MTLISTRTAHHRKMRAIAAAIGYPPKSEEGLLMAEQVIEHLCREGYRIIKKSSSGVAVAGAASGDASDPAAASEGAAFAREAAAASLRFYFANAAEG